MKLLLSECIVFYHRNENGQTALISAVLSKNVDAIKHLLQNGADVAIKTNAGETAQDIAQELVKHFPQGQASTEARAVLAELLAHAKRQQMETKD